MTLQPHSTRVKAPAIKPNSEVDVPFNNERQYEELSLNPSIKEEGITPRTKTEESDCLTASRK